MQPSSETTSNDERPLRERITYPLSRIEDKYPYDEWFDGGVWKLQMYEDFFVRPSSMQSAVYQAARKRGLGVRTHLPSTDDAIYIQAYKREKK